ncbi:MAG: type II toxin-antitoxin system ParD family antitoxin [Candidatus Acidiferrum sp.]
MPSSSHLRWNYQANDLAFRLPKGTWNGLGVNASEVVRAGLRNLEREEQEYAAKLVALRAAIDEGDASGIVEGTVFGRVRKTLKLPASSR